MWGVLPWAFCTISVLFGTILACDPIMLYKRIEGPPLRQQELSPVEGNRRSLNQCSRWCADKPQCYAVTWEPGSCTQVGPGSNGAIVGTTAFIVKRHPYALGKRSIWYHMTGWGKVQILFKCAKLHHIQLTRFVDMVRYTHIYIHIYVYIYIHRNLIQRWLAVLSWEHMIYFNSLWYSIILWIPRQCEVCLHSGCIASEFHI